jgi:dimethylargininase
MLTAITRSPGPELARCELTHLERLPIDIGRALAQHRAYLDVLRGTGVHLVELPADAALPDGVFVEDAAVVLDEMAVLTFPAPPSRRGELKAVEAALRSFRPVARVPAGACLEGGDVLRVGRTLYVGLSSRTCSAGVEALKAIVRPAGHDVVPVRVTGCLHLKSACCALGDETLLVNRAWLDVGAFTGLDLVDVPPEEPWGANVLLLPGAVVVSGAFPRTAEEVGKRGHNVIALDVGELHKAEAGLTCMSLLFEGPPAESPL